MSNIFHANLQIRVVLKNIQLSEATIFNFMLYGENQVSIIHHFQRWIAFKLFLSIQVFLMDVTSVKKFEEFIEDMGIRLMANKASKI
jgi:hypothetical protein